MQCALDRARAEQKARETHRSSVAAPDGRSPDGVSTTPEVAGRQVPAAGRTGIEYPSRWSDAERQRMQRVLDQARADSIARLAQSVDRAEAQGPQVDAAALSTPEAEAPLLPERRTAFEGRHRPWSADERQRLQAALDAVHKHDPIKQRSEVRAAGLDEHKEATVRLNVERPTQAEVSASVPLDGSAWTDQQRAALLSALEVLRTSRRTNEASLSDGRMAERNDEAFGRFQSARPVPPQAATPNMDPGATAASDRRGLDGEVHAVVATDAPDEPVQAVQASDALEVVTWSLPAAGPEANTRETSGTADPGVMQSGDRSEISTRVDARELPPQPAGLKLDWAKLAQIQEDSKAATAFLAGIFEEEERSVSPIVMPDKQSNASQSAAIFAKLDVQHAAFARDLVTRDEWSRDALAHLANQHDVMLDGALETINEVAFDEFDVPLVEGDDPVVVSPALLEKFQQSVSR